MDSMNGDEEHIEDDGEEILPVVECQIFLPETLVKVLELLCTQLDMDISILIAYLISETAMKLAPLSFTLNAMMSLEQAGLVANATPLISADQLVNELQKKLDARRPQLEDYDETVSTEIENILKMIKAKNEERNS